MDQQREIFRYRVVMGLDSLAIGMIACIAIVPLALICGGICGIPFYWRLVDCSFGVLGIVPLDSCWRLGRGLRGSG